MEKLEKWAVLAAALVTIIGFPLLFISLWYAHRLDVKISQQLGEITKIAQSENSIALNTMLLNDSSNAAMRSNPVPTAVVADRDRPLRRAADRLHTVQSLG